MHQPQEQHQRREQERQSTKSPSTASKTRAKSTFLSWILNNGTADSKSASAAKDQHTSIPDRQGGYRTSTDSRSLSMKSHYLDDKLEIADDTNGAKSYADTENIYKRNNNISVTQADKSAAMISSCAPELNTGHHRQQQQVQIPDRRQSHLYTLYLNKEDQEGGSEEEATTLIDYRHKSYYQSQLSPAINVIDVTTSNSSTTLTRSATWQPSSTTSQMPPSNQYLSPHPTPSPPPPPVPPHGHAACPSLTTAQGTAENMIPARRTSRNYSEDPEIQAKLDALLQSEKATYLSHMIQNNNLSNTNMYRRSTTPKSRKL
ncbi:hypothetical protein V8B55DRAFT_1465853 [Mucor lusitanicus]|uniref:Uncharacterized protein n=2 Tax=Mucor circinelloides f. lusitanicus TaxID=29924 RepID=A0A168JIX7_MUCCL|nr:hypothetical protein FB192DRAFT_1355859 [Mucor lusitanicus]OAD01258.1 hypothetical protein MUCCIDRAFT_165153 [Mucor lusitanicus CBS 277.49]